MVSYSRCEHGYAQDAFGTCPECHYGKPAATVPYTVRERAAVDAEYDAVMRTLNPDLYRLAAENGVRMGNSPEFQSLLAAALWWRDYAVNLSEGRNAFPESPYPALYEYTPAPPSGVTPQERP